MQKIIGMRWKERTELVYKAGVQLNLIPRMLNVCVIYVCLMLDPRALTLIICQSIFGKIILVKVTHRDSFIVHQKTCFEMANIIDQQDSYQISKVYEIKEKCTQTQNTTLKLNAKKISCIQRCMSIILATQKAEARGLEV